MEQLSRRIFIRNTSSGLLSIAFLNPLFGLKKKNNNQEIWKELIDYARWSPTIHNLQPHLVRIISETEAELHYNPLRLLSVGDPDSIFATIAMGIFIENLSIASSYYGKKVEVTQIFNPISVKNKEITLFAKLKLSNNYAKETIDRELILNRKTSRLHYDGKALSSDVISMMKEQAKGFNHDFFSTSDESSIESIIQLNQETLFSDLESKPMREELNKLFRYTKNEAESYKDGLWSECMGFSGILMRSVFNKYEKWIKGLRKELLSNKYKNSFKGTKTICWLSGNFDNTNDWIQAGRMFARNWLILTQNEAFLHPFGSLITNEIAYEKINKKFGQPEEDKKIWMIFRAGYSKEPSRSFRLTTNEIII